MPDKCPFTLPCFLKHLSVAGFISLLNFLITRFCVVFYLTTNVFRHFHIASNIACFLLGSTIFFSIFYISCNNILSHFGTFPRDTFYYTFNAVSITVGFTVFIVVLFAKCHTSSKYLLSISVSVFHLFDILLGH